MRQAHRGAWQCQRLKGTGCIHDAHADSDSHSRAVSMVALGKLDSSNLTSASGNVLGSRMTVGLSRGMTM